MADCSHQVPQFVRNYLLLCLHCRWAVMVAPGCTYQHSVANSRARAHTHAYALAWYCNIIHITHAYKLQQSRPRPPQKWKYRSKNQKVRENVNAHRIIGVYSLFTLFPWYARSLETAIADTRITACVPNFIHIYVSKEKLWYINAMR